MPPCFRILNYIPFGAYQISVERHVPVSEPVRADVFAAACPLRALLSRIANKWSLLLIDVLGTERIRNGALLRRIEGISQKMLTETLRDLEDIGLVERHSLGTVPPHVEYALTPLGLSLREAVGRLDRWVEAHTDRLGALAEGDARVPRFEPSGSGDAAGRKTRRP